LSYRAPLARIARAACRSVTDDAHGYMTDSEMSAASRKAVFVVV
jgi:hypothetical protein